MGLETLAARLKAFREAKGLTKYRLAKLTQVGGKKGISQTYLYRLEKGEIKNPRRDTLQAIAQGLNITLAQLIGEIAPLETWQLVEQSLKAYIPVYAGVKDMEPIDYVACTREKAPPETLRGYRIEGLSLEPEIRDGDTLIVDTALAPINGDIVIVIIGEQPVLRRYQENHQELSIHGVVIEYVRKLRQM